MPAALLAGAAPGIAAATTEFVYEGRLATAGAPVSGPVSLRINFFHSNAQGSEPVLSVTSGLETVPLVEGVFQVALNIAAADYANVFGGGQSVWVQVTDMTHAPSVPFPMQKLSTVPFAARVPVDGQTIYFNSEGQLSMGPSTAPTAGQFLTKDADGHLVWATPGTLNTLQGQTISSTTPASGQVLQYNGAQWLPASVAPAAAGVTALTATAPLATSGSATAPNLLLTQATSVSAGYLSASDWMLFNAKLGAGGGTLTGALDMGAQTLTDLRVPVNASDAATKAYVDAATAGGGVATTVFGTGDTTASPGAGLMRGAAAAGSNIAGAAVTLQAGNGTGTGGSGPLYLQTAAAGASGSAVDTQLTRVAVTASGNVGIGTTNPGSLLDVAGALTQRGMAAPGLSSAGQGVLYFDSASAQFKISQNGNAFTPLLAGSALTSITGGGGLAGGTIATSGTLSLATLGTAGSYAKVITDAYGRVTGGTPLLAGDIPTLTAASITGGTFAAAQIPTLPAAVLGSGTLNLAQVPSLPAAQITSGTFSAAQIPALPANQITSGTFSTAQIPGLPATQITSGTFSSAQIPPLPASQITSGTLSLAQVPVLPAAQITSGTLALATLPSLPASLITSGTLALSTVPNLPASAIGSGTFSVAQIPNLGGSYVALSGSTMTGMLALAANGLSVGTTQLVINAGNIGLGTSAPAGKLDVFGSICLNGNNCITSWPSGGTASGGISSVSAGAGLTGGTITTSGSLSLAVVGTVGTFSKVTTDAYGRITSGGSLVASDIPSLPTTAIGSGTFGIGQIPLLPASQITSGTFALATVPSLPAGAITSGTLALATVPSLPASTITSGTLALATLPSLPASTITSGTLSQGVLPNLSASMITTGTLPLSTVPSLAASTITSGTLALATLPSLPASSITSGTLSLAVMPSFSGSYVALAGSTMAGALNLPANGLVAGSTQLALVGGNVGIGTNTPQSKLDIAGGVAIGNGYAGTSAAPVNGLIVQGNIGIGSTNPNFPLVVGSGTAAISFGGSDASTGAWIRNDNQNTVFSTNTGDLHLGYAGNTKSLFLYPGGTTPTMTIGSAGNVGIGTTIPGAPLAIDLGNTPASGAASSLIVLDQRNTVGGVAYGQFFGEKLFRWQDSGSPLLSRSALTFSLGHGMSTTADTDIMTMLSSGNVGIGSALPAGRLDVAGTICLNGANCISAWPGGGTSAVTSITAGAGLTGGTIAASGTIALPTLGLVGSYAKVVTDVYGRVTGGTTLLTSDLPTVSTSGISGTLGVAVGGTGNTSFANNAILVGSGGGVAIGTVATSTQYSVLTAGSGGAPSFGPVNLAQSAAVSGVLPVGNGGTGATTGSANYVFATPSGSSGAPTLRALTAADLPAHSAALITSGTLSAAVLPSLAGSYVALTGSTMAGALNLPANGLVAGTTQLVLANGYVGVGTASPATRLHSYLSVADSADIGAAYFNSVPTVSGSGTYTNAALQSTITPVISAGASNGGVAYASISNALRNSASDVGPLTGLSGQFLAFGHVGATARTTTSAYGMAIQPWQQGGTIANSYGVYLATPVGGGTVTNQYGVYQQDAATKNYFAGNVGIGSAAPNLALEVRGVNGAPATSGTLQTGVARFSSFGLSNVLDVGAYGASPYGLWLQTEFAADLSAHYPLALNPNGGNVGIGSATPVAALDVNGTAAASGGFGTIVSSVQPASNFSVTVTNWVYSGEYLTITVPSGPSRRYRLYLKQSFTNANTIQIGALISTSSSTPTNFMAQCNTTLLGGQIASCSGETYVTLAPGTYTYYVMVGAGAGGTLSSCFVYNAAMGLRPYSDFFAVQQ